MVNDVSEPTRDQTPEPWSEGASGYDTAFAPFTGLYVEEALDLLDVHGGTNLLDVAAGTGAVTLRAAARGATVTAVDFAPGMVDHLAREVAAAGLSSVTTRVMDGQSLDLVDDSFDAAISMLGVIFFPDIDAGLRELHRVVAPDGPAGVGTWNLEAFRLVDFVRAAFERVLPEMQLPSAQPAWARVGTIEGLRERLEEAGFLEVSVHVIPRRWRFEDPEAFFLQLPTWSPPVQPLFEMLSAETLTAAAGAFADVFEEAAAESGGDGVPTEVLLGVGLV